MRVAGPHPVHERKAIGEGEREGGERGNETRAASTTEPGHATRGQRVLADVKRGCDGSARYTCRMPQKDPHAVLGIEHGASPDDIKAAWRRLARRHHPDLTGDDPEAVRRATRRMAEINAAYAGLTRAGETIEGRSARAERPGRGAQGTGTGRGPFARATNGAHATDGARRGGPPPEPPTRPVTGRLDLSDTVRPRNQTVTPPGVRLPLTGHPPLRTSRATAELRASQPSGPLERDWLAGHVPPQTPALDDALDVEVGFGKFHGHTLGEIAAFEPSYIDWLAGTVTREPELALAARVIRAELDRRGIHREHRPARPGWQSNPFR